MKKIMMVVAVAALVAVTLFAGFMNNQTDINADLVLEATAESGWIGEKIIGDINGAKVVIFEYADFGCSHCAEQNKTVNELIKKHDGEVAVVFRSYDLGFQNGSLAARAATAAQIQGYFEAYKDILFNNQTEWMYVNGEKLDALWISYFKQVSDEEGNVDKFKEDIKSDAIKKRLKFEQKLSKIVNLRGTPLFQIDGQDVSPSELSQKVSELLSE